MNVSESGSVKDLEVGSEKRGGSEDECTINGRAGNGAGKVSEERTSGRIMSAVRGRGDESAMRVGDIRVCSDHTKKRII